MLPKQRVVKVNELQLCQVCMKHPADRECYTKGKADFKGCSEGGSSMEHHPLLHWALIITRLFQVQVAAESYPLGTQIFLLRQRVKMGKVKVGLVQRWPQPHSGIQEVCREEEAQESVYGDFPITIYSFFTLLHNNNSPTTPYFSATAVVDPSPKQYISSPELLLLVPVPAQLFP
jgi:hypothetical protein